MPAEKSHHRRSQVAVMFPICCSFCQRPNPADAKYCNECGNTLALKPCAHCDAVNDLHAAQCRVCGEPLAEPGPAAPPHTLSAHASSRSLGGALEAIRSHGLRSGGMRSAMGADDALASSAARALDAIEAVPASLDTSDAIAAPNAGKSPVRVPRPGFPKRGETRPSANMHSPRAIVAPSLAIAACVVAFRADQQATYPQPPIAAPIAGPATSVHAPAASFPAMDSLSSSHLRQGIAATNGSPSHRATHGSIANAAEGERTTEPVAATPVSPDATGPQPYAATVAASIEARNAPATPHAFPIAASRCTESIAALGLCEDKQ
jgi:hypothetical protein